MKETLDLLATLNLENKKEIITFLNKLKEEYKKYISVGSCGFDPTKTADNALTTFSGLKEHHGINDNSLKKINVIDEKLGSKGEYSYMLVEICQAINTIKNQLPESEINKRNILSFINDFNNKINGIGEHNSEAKKVALTLHSIPQFL
jgi:hypothetical protein